MTSNARAISHHHPDPANEHLEGQCITCDANCAVAPVDLSSLEELVGNDAVLILEVLDCFELSAAKSRAELEQALDRGTPQAAARTAHNMKSVARYIGARHLGEICSSIEETCQYGTIEGLKTLMPMLQAELEAILSFIQAMRQARE